MQDALRYRRAYSHKDYVDLLAKRLREQNYTVTTEERVDCRIDGHDLTPRRADLVVENLVAVEVKVQKKIPDHAMDQLRAYLRDGGWDVGLVINFGARELQLRRVELPAGVRR